MRPLDERDLLLLQALATGGRAPMTASEVLRAAGLKHTRDQRRKVKKRLLYLARRRRMAYTFPIDDRGGYAFKAKKLRPDKPTRTP